MKVVGAPGCELSGYESLGDAPGRNRSASERAFCAGRRGYIAAIAASGCQTLVPSARFGGNVNPWRPDATGAPVLANGPTGAGHRYTSDDPLTTSATRGAYPAASE